MIDLAYKELNLDNKATLQEVRSKYIELAKRHHPDKLIGKTDEEIKENEEKFKKITNAYHKIINHHNGTNNDINIGDEWINKLWIFLKDPDLWENIKDIIDKISKKEDKHIIVVPITLEELHNKKVKKLRLFLKGEKHPIFCNIDCDKYPGYLYNHNDKNIQFYMILKEHNIYRNDDLINMWDLYVTIKISWLDYINGLSSVIKYLDDSEIKIDIPAFPNFEDVIVYKNKGLCNKGDLYVCYEMINITKDKWEILNNDKKNIFKETLKSLG